MMCMYCMYIIECLQLDVYLNFFFFLCNFFYLFIFCTFFLIQNKSIVLYIFNRVCTWFFLPYNFCGQLAMITVHLKKDELTLDYNITFQFLSGLFHY